MTSSEKQGRHFWNTVLNQEMDCILLENTSSFKLTLLLGLLKMLF